MTWHHMLRKAGLSVFISIVLLSLTLNVDLSQQQANAASSVTINGATTYQKMDGFGSSEAFGMAEGIENLPAGPQRQVLDLLFSPTTGAGLTILRNLFPSDASHTIEPNSPGSPTAPPTYTWDNSSWGQVWISQQAQRYGVRQFYGDAWSAPGFMKTNGTENNGGALCGTPGATCSTGDWRQAYANYLLQYYKDYLSDGVKLTEIGAYNEPNWTASYSSMVMNPTQTADFISVLGPTLRAAGARAQIVCCDPVNWYAVQSYTDGITSNPVANAYTSIISSHGYGRGPDSPVTGIGNKHVWETEWSTFQAFDPAWDDGSDASGFSWAQNIYTGMTAANLNAFLYWWGAANAGDNEPLIQFDSTGTVNVSARLWTFANYSRFIRPGAVRIGASSGDSNLEVTAYRNINGTVSIVVLNTSSSAITTAYSLQNTRFAGNVTVTPYLTNGSNNTAQQAAIPVRGDDSFNATIPARSLVTYVIRPGLGN